MRKEVKQKFLHLKNEDVSNRVRDSIRIILEAIENKGGYLREGLKDTPERYAKFLSEFLNPEPFKISTFEGDEYDGMVIVKDVPFYSLCEHHLAPFFGSATIAYIPNQETKRIIGLSKLPRILDYFSRRLQNQERITTEIADFINESLNPVGVAVSLTARHLCMEMRGVKKTGSKTTTNRFLGAFKSDFQVREEFFKNF